MLTFLYYLISKIKVVTVVSNIYFDSKYHVKCKFASKFIQLVTITNLVSIEVVQRCQHCQLCVLRETRLCDFYIGIDEILVDSERSPRGVQYG